MSQTPPPEEQSHVRRLERRIAQLEQKIENQPADFIDAVRAQLARAYGLELSRRDVIASLTGAGIGAAALLALTPQQAAAAVVGNIGTNADPLSTVYTSAIDPGTSGSTVQIPGLDNGGSAISITDQINHTSGLLNTGTDDRRGVNYQASSTALDTTFLGNDSQAHAYMTDSNYVIAYKTGDTVYYLSISLDGADTTWSVGTSEPT